MDTLSPTICAHNVYPQYIRAAPTIRYPQYHLHYIVGNPCGCSTYVLWVQNVYIVGHPQYIRHYAPTIYTSCTHNMSSTIYSTVLSTIYTLDFPQYIHCCPQHIQPPKNPRVGSPTKHTYILWGKTYIYVGCPFCAGCCGCSCIYCG